MNPNPTHLLPIVPLIRDNNRNCRKKYLLCFLTVFFLSMFKISLCNSIRSFILTDIIFDLTTSKDIFPNKFVLIPIGIVLLKG